MVVHEQALTLGVRVADVADRFGHRLHSLRMLRQVLVDVRLERHHRVVQARSAFIFLACREELAVDGAQKEKRQHGHEYEGLKRGAPQMAPLASFAQRDDASRRRSDDDELRDDDDEQAVEDEL